MTRINLANGGAQGRAAAKLSAAFERITAKAKRPEMLAAVAAMRQEWPAATTCDHCNEAATFVWERTPKQLKAMQARKYKGSRLPVQPVSWRCSKHVPYAFPELGENYRDARVSRPDLAVAA